MTLHATYAHAFFDALDGSARLALNLIRATARQSPPADYIALRSGAQTLGYLSPEHADALAGVLSQCELQNQALIWRAQDLAPELRSAQLQAALVRLRDMGRLTGWRDEAFCFWSVTEPSPDPQQAAYLKVERAGFRFLGMMSHAVHINGFMPDGSMWCGQRSANKATDPGMWDNFTAGGLAAGETWDRCARRELWEEAGFCLQAPEDLLAIGRVRISRVTSLGWHDEMLHIFNLCLPARFVPSNQDGEVQAFACLAPTEVLTRISAQQFTSDAALAIAQGVLFPDAT
jgi:8-oxo-dGTP pyrophosphatase MutT (NUDIX family)